MFKRSPANSVRIASNAGKIAIRTAGGRCFRRRNHADDDYGRLPPLSPLYAAAISVKAGHDVVVIDAIIGWLTLEQVIARLPERRPARNGLQVGETGK